MDTPTILEGEWQYTVLQEYTFTCFSRVYHQTAHMHVLDLQLDNQLDLCVKHAAGAKKIQADTSRYKQMLILSVYQHYAP